MIRTAVKLSLLIVMAVPGFVSSAELSTRQEAKLRRDIRVALNLNGSFADDQVGIVVSKDVVQLRGRVGSTEERALAERIAERKASPLTVRNELEIKPLPKAAAELGITQRIKRALLNHPRIEGDDVIDVDAKGAQVILTGIVSNWGEHHLASRVAFDQGAKEVTVKIRVRAALRESDRAFHYRSRSELKSRG